MDFKTSQTYVNLMSSVAAESVAAVKYALYGAKAKQEGYAQIDELLRETAANEQAHAKLLLQLLNGGALGSTSDNLTDAAANERNEWSNVYAGFEQTARQEGYADIAETFRKIAEIEKAHEQRFNKLLDNMNHGLIYRKPSASLWTCRNCGFELRGDGAPAVCPVCGYPQAYFQVKANNY